jgi:ATP-dependent protease ClpP protease subunit
MVYLKRFRVEEENESAGVDEINSLVYRRGTDVFFWVDVSRQSIIRLVEVLHEATEEALVAKKKKLRSGKKVEPCVHLYIQSYGGDAFAGISAMAHIRNNRVKVVTIADGMVASAATLMLLGGVERYITPFSHVLIHQLTAGFYGKHQDLRDEYLNASNVMRSLSAIYVNETGLSERRVKKMLRKELDLTSDQCIKYGIVHGVFPPPVSICVTAV